MSFNQAALLFPGQGAQFPGMGKDFWHGYPEARETFEEADEILGRNLSKIVFEGPEQLLTETKNSQLGIYVCSIALWRVCHSLFPQFVTSYSAGLSLGEYSALCASQRFTFAEGLRLVDLRARFMNDACEATPGTMAVLLGMDAAAVDQLVKHLNLPNELWVANYNCPGQVVISGTRRAIQRASEVAKEHGAKRVLPLQVHGAFHSGLMRKAEELLTPYIETAQIQDTPISLVMNVSGGLVSDQSAIRLNLVKQVTHSVRWEQSMRTMIDGKADLFLECGPGKTLAGFYKRIGGTAPFFSIEKIEDLRTFEQGITKR